MSSTPDKCPRCGSALDTKYGHFYLCGSVNPRSEHGRSDLCRLLEARALLRRLLDSYHPDDAGEGTYWRAEIERVLNGDTK